MENGNEHKKLDTQELVTGVRWDILQLIAARPSTGAELAQELGTSAANVAQHLKLLELGGLTVKERVNGKSMHYKIARKVALITLLDNNARRLTLPLDELKAAELRLLFENRPGSRALRGFICQHEELARSFIAFGVLHEEQDIQLLVIASDVKSLRKEYANIQVAGRKIVIWSHTPQEFEEGLARRDNYFTDKLSAVQILSDTQNLFENWRNKFA